jgi:spermidine/putrescine transport system substrate-binding protein
MDEMKGPGVRRMSRRAALTRGAGGLLAAGSLPALLAACGDDDDSSSGSSSTTTNESGELTGTITLLSYPDWYGPDEFAQFEKLHPGVTVKTVATPGGVAGTVAQVINHKDDYDLTLAGPGISAQLDAAELVAPLDTSKVPNVSLVGEPFREAFSLGIPTDYGKTGFAYRRDLISERPTSWREFWDLSEKYSGKVTTFNFDVDVQGSALRMLGFGVNTTDEDELSQMQDALLELKPHLKAILNTDFAKPLVQGTAVMGMDYDYDIAAVQERNKDIVWVSPTEGMSAYIEGWTAINTSEHLDTVWALMDFHLRPKVYASFINAVGAAYVMPDAEQYIKPAIRNNPTLRYDVETLENVEFTTHMGVEGTAARGKLWEEFVAA